MRRLGIRGRGVGMPKTKRTRGGQPGNKNARKHGFYSTGLSPDEIHEFWNTVNKEGIDPDIAILRVKIVSTLRNAPDNHRVLLEGSKLIVKWCNSHYCLGKKDRSELKKITRNILKAAVTGDLEITKRIVAESLQKVEKSQNDSYLIHENTNQNNKTNRS